MAETKRGAGVPGQTRAESVEAPDREAGSEVLKCFGRQVKILRERAGITQAELGRRVGYSEDLVSSVEQGRRVPQPAFIDAADRELDAGGLLAAAKEQMLRVRFPTWFQDFARLEGEAVELHAYDSMVVNGLLQTEDYARALFTMRRPMLDEEVIEQRVAARLARQEILGRRPAAVLSFVMEQAVLQRPLGGPQVRSGQLRHLLRIGELRNVEIQVMPMDRCENAGIDGPFILLAPKRLQQMAYLEGQGRSTLVTEANDVHAIATRYGIIRAQALGPRESLDLIEKLLGET